MCDEHLASPVMVVTPEFLLQPSVDSTHLSKNCPSPADQYEILTITREYWFSVEANVCSGFVLIWKYYNCPTKQRGWEWLKKMVSGGKREPFIWEHLSIHLCCLLPPSQTPWNRNLDSYWSGVQNCLIGWKRWKVVLSKRERFIWKYLSIPF